MSKSDRLSAAIQPQGLFWDQAELNPWTQRLTEDQREDLRHAEILDWISSIYWGETLGVQYALEMVRRASTEADQVLWRKVLAEEVDHQQRIANWLTLRGHAPNPPNRLLEEAFRRVGEATASRKGEGLSKLILWGQVFFEELGAVLIRWRLPFVDDRELRAILYRIYSDEMVHISAGKRVLERLGEEVPRRADVLGKKAALIFPLHLMPAALRTETEEARQAGTQCVRTLLNQRLSDVERYKPSPLLQRWMNVEGYHCIGCHPKRSEGLLLDPQFDREKSEAVDEVVFSRRFEGMNDLVHGGFTSMALDEVMGYAINHQHNRLAFTTRLTVQFIKPVKVGKRYRVVGKVQGIEDSKALVRGTILDPVSGAVLAQAEADFYLLNEATASKLLPGALKDPETCAMLQPGQNSRQDTPHDTR